VYLKLTFTLCIFINFSHLHHYFYTFEDAFLINKKKNYIYQIIIKNVDAYIKTSVVGKHHAKRYSIHFYKSNQLTKKEP